MDTVGSNGVIICRDKERNRKYQVYHAHYLNAKQITLRKFVIYFRNRNENKTVWLHKLYLIQKYISGK